jgi:hypothetical protein
MAARSFRRLVAEHKALWRKDNQHIRSLAGDYLVPDWAVAALGFFVLFAVMAFCGRFVCGSR